MDPRYNPYTPTGALLSRMKAILAGSQREDMRPGLPEMAS
jgi:hypothetical protein